VTAVIVYRVAGYWAPGAAGAVTAALLTRRDPAWTSRPVTPLRPQAPPPPAHASGTDRRHPRPSAPAAAGDLAAARTQPVRADSR
jgi:hypothetical protein